MQVLSSDEHAGSYQQPELFALSSNGRVELEATRKCRGRSLDPNRSEDRYGKLPTCSLRFSAQPRGADFRSGIAAVPTAAACEPEAFAVKRAPRLKWLSLKTASLGFCWEHPPTCARKSKPHLSCVRATEFANRPSPEQFS